MFARRSADDAEAVPTYRGVLARTLPAAMLTTTNSGPAGWCPWTGHKDSVSASEMG
jgi:hypothetical protein